MLFILVPTQVLVLLHQLMFNQTNEADQTYTEDLARRLEQFGI